MSYDILPDNDEWPPLFIFHNRRYTFIRLVSGLRRIMMPYPETYQVLSEKKHISKSCRWSKVSKELSKVHLRIAITPT